MCSGRLWQAKAVTPKERAKAKAQLECDEELQEAQGDQRSRSAHMRLIRRILRRMLQLPSDFGHCEDNL